jgi:hypothetical protein
VFQPLNVYPALVNPFVVKLFVSSYLIDTLAVVQVASSAFLLNAIVYVIGVH